MARFNDSYAGRLVLAALDMILMPDGQWHVIEVNDQGAGLATTDREAGRYPNSLFAHKGMGFLAETFARRSSGKAVCILLGEKYSIGNCNGWTQYIEFSPAMNVSISERDASKAKYACDDINQMILSIKSAGAECYIADVSGLECEGDRLKLKNGPEIGLVFDGSIKSFSKYSGITVYNDLRTKLICKNKLLLGRLLERAGLQQSNFVTHQFINSPKVCNYIESLAAHNEFVIVKPTRRNGSSGVRRISASRALAELKRQPAYADSQLAEDLESQLALRNCLLIQPWVKSKPFAVGAVPYHLEFRISAVGGIARSGWARVGGKPLSLANTRRDAWLGPIGTRASVRVGDGVGAYGGKEVVITDAEKHSLLSAVERAVRAIEECAAALTAEQVKLATPPLRRSVDRTKILLSDMAQLKR